MQTVIVFIIIGLAAAYVAYRVYRNWKNAKERRCDCGCCSGCGINKNGKKVWSVRK